MIPKRLRLPVIDQNSSPPQRIYVSENSKTGMSVNTPIVGTCKPTKACSSYCYGLTGPISFKPSLRKQFDNLKRFEYLETVCSSDLQKEASRIYHTVRPEHTYLRFFGVGDLTPGSVRLINALSAMYPDLILWVASRKISLASKLHIHDNVFVMLSVDQSTPKSDLNSFRALIKKHSPHVFASYTQLSEDDTPPDWIYTVFAHHKVGGKRSTWSKGTTDSRMCPATIQDGAEHENACDRCRRCFSVPFNTQKE